MDIMDEEIVRAENGPPWYPLETILSSWIDMIHDGKITAAPEGVNLENEKQDPWINHRYSIRQVEDTALAFEKLVDAIESRMPSSSLSEATTSPLLEKSTLDSAEIPEGCFARDFILRARRPRFSRIAPGLKIPTAESFASSQSFISVENDDEDRIPIPPVLLFQAANEETHQLIDDEKPFSTPYDRIETVPAGLFSTDVNIADPHLAEEGFKLILPFAVGQNEHARKSDGSKFNNAWELYQHGYESFGGDPRPQRMVKLFENWLGMIEAGHWEVGQDGVAGQIEKLRESDTENWQRYWIAPSW
jgi:hypothetical protein